MAFPIGALFGAFGGITGLIAAIKNRKAKKEKAARGPNPLPEGAENLSEKSQQKVTGATYPRARNWWENTKKDTGEGIKKAAEGVKETLTSTPGKEMTFQRFTPDQQKLLDSVLGQAQQGLQQQPHQFDFEPIAQESRLNFAQNTIPSIAERFTSLGARRSGAFRNALSSAKGNLEANLAAQKADYGFQQAGRNEQRQQALMALGLTPSFSSIYSPPEPGLIQQSIPALARVGAAYFGGR